MNLKYFLYQFVAAFFLIMAGVAVANFLTFELIELFYSHQGTEEAGKVLEQMQVANLRQRMKLALIMWAGATVISFLITFSRKMQLGHTILVAIASFVLFLLLHRLSAPGIMQSWVIEIFGLHRTAFLFNFIFCMIASYWLFRRSAQIEKTEEDLEKPEYDDILDA